MLPCTDSFHSFLSGSPALECLNVGTYSSEVALSLRRGFELLNSLKTVKDYGDF